MHAASVRNPGWSPRTSTDRLRERAFWGDPAAEWIFAFLDIPVEFWRAYGRDLSTPMLDGDAAFRRCCDQARGALQLILDAHRHGFAADFAHEGFASSLRHAAERPG